MDNGVAMNAEGSGFGALGLQESAKPAYVVYKRHDEEPVTMTWRDVFETAQRIAGQINPTGEPQQTGVIITCNDELNFATALLATWLTGATAIPTTNTFRRNLNDRNTHIYNRTAPDIVLHDMTAGAAHSRLLELAPNAEFVNVDSAREARFSGGSSPKIRGSLLQYTSGSTTNPKPVLLGPAEVRGGCKAIAKAYGLSTETVGIHWLPLYHDMGLIGSVVMPLWTGGTSVIMRPSVFIQRPSLWFELATQWKADITAAPNFAYEYVLSRLEPSDADGIDLSSMASLIIGGEPVRPATLRRLYAAGPGLGLPRAAVKPSYGMAEATLLVSRFSGDGDKQPFSQRHSSEEITCLGQPVDEVQVEIRDPESDQALQAGDLGNIWITGEAVGTVVPQGANWRAASVKQPVKTGDVGFQDEGAIYVVGRESNLLIIRGANFFAEDIETAILNTQPPGVITGIAALSLDNPEQGTDALYLFIEVAGTVDRIEKKDLNQALSQGFGLKAQDILFLKTRSLPRTSSGKVIRRQVKDLYIDGTFNRFILKGTHHDS